MTAWKMPKRIPTDGPVGIRRVGDHYLALSFDGHEVTISLYNAARIFGMIALFLEIPLPKKLGAAIKLTPPGAEAKMTLEWPEPKTLGERIAQRLVRGAVEKVLLGPARCVHGTNPPEMCEHAGCHRKETASP